MGRFATGVTVIIAEANGETRGMTANAFMSGSLDPPLCVVSVARRAHMHNHLLAAKVFSVNVLAAGQEAYAGHFAGRPLPARSPSRRPQPRSRPMSSRRMSAATIRSSSAISGR
jgi:flavin reductase (DIM6/NTAB) family NADH-FMN oxidoreductase RutF